MTYATEGSEGVTRRAALRRAGQLGVLAATAPVIAGGSVTPAWASSKPSAASGAVRTINFLGYEGDDFPTILRAWERANRIRLSSTYINDDSELIARIRSGATNADLISCSNPDAPYEIAAGTVTPLDPSKLPNLGNLWRFFAKTTPGFFRDTSGRWCTVPAYWGSIGIAWDRTVVPRVSSWYDILRPAFKGKVGLVDAPTIHLSVVAQLKGFDSAKMTAGDLTAFKNFMLPILRQARVVTVSFGDLISLLGSKEIGAVFPGYTFIAGGARAAGNKDVALNIDLKEGSPLEVEMYAIPPTAHDTSAAYEFINHELSPKVAAEIAAAQGSITTVTTAVRYLDPGTRALYPYRNLERFLRNKRVLANPPPSSTRYVTAEQLSNAWTEVKLQAGH